MTEPALLAGRRGLVVSVSGEASIGFACARMMRAMGAEVAATYRPARRESCARLLEGEGIVLHAPLDFDEEGSAAAALATIAASWDRLDFVVHTVVHVPEGLLARPLVDLTREQFDRVVGTSAHSLVALCRHALPLMRASSAARVVTLTSASGHLMTPSYHVAGIAKAALGATVLYLAQELGPEGILVNAVSTSLHETDGALRAVGAENARKTRQALARRAPTRRPVELDEVARAVAYLASPFARSMTAETLNIDAGYSRTYF